MAERTQTLIERLYAEHGERVLGYVLKHIRDPAQAADLAQETFTRMLETDLEQVQNPEGYLYAVALNLIRERYRLGRRDQSHIDVDDPVVQELLAEQPSFALQIDDEQRTGRLHEVLRELPEKCYYVVVLHYWYGLTYEEIAEKIGISTHMVKKYVTQALMLGRRRMARLG
jgi:RNA polymerase sigma-70 factor (ECF subfamily)